MDKREEFIKRIRRLGINSHYGIMIPDKDILNPCANCMQNCNACCHEWETEVQIYQEALEEMTAERDMYAEIAFLGLDAITEIRKEVYNALLFRKP